MNKSNIALAVGGLGIGTTEFVIMGLLPDVTSSLGITIPQGGHLISAYALGVVVGAPVLVGLSARYAPKKVLLFLMCLFTVFNGLAALAPDYYTMLIARFFCGLPHGAFFGIGSVVAGKLAQKGKEAQAISIMFAGLTLANLLVVPLGTYIGHAYSWRLTFGLITIIGLLTLISLYAWMPVIPADNNRTVRDELQIFKRKEVMLLVLMTAIGTGGLFTWLSYIAPLIINVTRFAPSTVPYIMVMAGAGMVVGNLIGGWMADRFAPARACLLVLTGVAACLLLSYFAAPFKIPMLAMTFITGTVTFCLAAPIQILMIRTATGAEMLGASLTQAAFNMGNALGAYWGGLPIAAGLGLASPLLVGVGMAGMGVLVLFAFMHYAKEQAMTEQTC